MGKLIRAQFHSVLFNGACLAFAVIVLALTLVTFFEPTGDFRNMNQLQLYIRDDPQNAGLSTLRDQYDLRGFYDLEEMLAILKQRQVIAAPGKVVSSMFVLLILLPGVILSPALTRSRGIGPELQYYGRQKPLLARMLGAWLLCFILSTGMYVFYLADYTDCAAAPLSQLLRNYFAVQLFILAFLCYSFFVYTLLKRAWLAIPAMILADALLHRIIPGLYVFYPLYLMPVYTPRSYLNETSLVGARCGFGTFILYLLVCLAYAILCFYLTLRLNRRREYP